MIFAILSLFQSFLIDIYIAFINLIEFFCLIQEY
jgi:hypothetical protein